MEDDAITVDDIRGALGEQEFAELVEKVKREKEDAVVSLLERFLMDEVRSFIRDNERAYGRDMCVDALRRIFWMVDVGENGDVHISFRPPETRRTRSARRVPVNVRSRKVDRTQERDFRNPILQTLEELGGRARTDEVRQLIEGKMNGKLRADDSQPVPSTGEARWWNTAKWERKHMTEERPPLLNPSSPRGWWEITEAGREYLRNARA